MLLLRIPMWAPFLIFVPFLLVFTIRYFLLKLDGGFFERTIVPYTKFLYEDGNYYHFKITDRSSYSTYYNIRCYKKTKIGLYQEVGKEKMVDTDLKQSKIKKEIKQILQPYTAKFNGNQWDGFVGDIPMDVRREGRFKELLDKK